MASLYNKFLDFIGIEETDDIDEEDSYYRGRASGPSWQRQRRQFQQPVVCRASARTPRA